MDTYEVSVIQGGGRVDAPEPSIRFGGLHHDCGFLNLSTNLTVHARIYNRRTKLVGFCAVEYELVVRTGFASALGRFALSPSESAGAARTGGEVVLLALARNEHVRA